VAMGRNVHKINQAYAKPEKFLRAYPLKKSSILAREKL